MIQNRFIALLIAIGMLTALLVGCSSSSAVSSVGSATEPEITEPDNISETKAKEAPSAEPEEVLSAESEGAPASEPEESTADNIGIPTEPEILEALNSMDDFMPYAEITEVTIQRSQTFMEQRQYKADIAFNANDEYADYTGTASIVYNLYDGGLWMLDEVNDTALNTLLKKPSTIDSIWDNLYENTRTDLDYLVLAEDGTTGSFEIINCTEPSISDEYNSSESILVTWRTQLGYVYEEYETEVLYSYSNGQWLFAAAVDTSFMQRGITGLNGKTFVANLDDNQEISIVDITLESITFEYSGVQTSGQYTFSEGIYYMDDGQRIYTLEYTTDNPIVDEGNYKSLLGGSNPTYDYYKLDFSHLYSDSIMISLSSRSTSMGSIEAIVFYPS